jgi:hypothetical protein
VELVDVRPEQAWRLYVDNLRRVRFGSSFSATCLVPRTDEAVSNVFDNDEFVRYCRTSYDCLRRRSLGRIQKVFIVPDSDIIRRCISLQEHLIEIDTLSTQLGITRLEPRVLIFDEARIRHNIEHFPHDFMIWGEEGVTLSSMEEGLTVRGVTYYTDADHVRRFRGEFDTWFGMGESVRDVLCRLLLLKAD